MRILLLHNTYKNKGGEDAVLENEYQLLLSNNNIVDKLMFYNSTISNVFDRIRISLFSLYNRSSAKKLKNKIISFQPDVIHIHNFFPIASPSIFYIARSMAVPIVMTLHNYRLICPSGLLLHKNRIYEKAIHLGAFSTVLDKVYRESYIGTFILACVIEYHKKVKTWHNKVDQFISLTYFSKDKFKEANFSVKNFSVKPNFVKDHGYDYNKGDYFIFVGRFSEEKGVALLLKVFSSLQKKLIIIGGGPLEDYVKEKSNKYSNIEYIGFKDNMFIIKKLKKAKALIFTSICYEGMPMTILESLSVGTPVIAPNIGGPNEIINSGNNGLIYKVGDKVDLTNKIKQIDSNMLEYKKLVKGARSSFETKYSSDKNYLQLMEIYNRVINA